MKVRAWMSLFTCASALAAAFLACSSNDDDGSTTADGGVDATASADAPSGVDATRGDGGAAESSQVCSPIALPPPDGGLYTQFDGDVPDATPLPLRPAYRPYGRGLTCTSRQLADFAALCARADASAGSCSQWSSDPANSSCRACINTPSTDPTWGAIVFVPTSSIGNVPNVAGCYGMALDEGARTDGCGGARWTLDRCLEYTCPLDTCAGDPNNPTAAEYQLFLNCRARGVSTVCKPYADDQAAKCGTLSPDAAAFVESCAPDASLPDFALAITTAFCGGSPADAGAD